MGLAITGVNWVLAFLPLALLLFLLLAMRWGVFEAAPLAWVVAVIVGLSVFGMSVHGVGSQSAKGIWSGLSIVYIIWPAILIYEVSREADAFDPLRKGITRLLPHPLLQVLAFGWAFDGFLQGITGFGAPVAVCAPLLIGIGVRPVYAVVISLMGQAWNNTFGTLAVAWLGLTQVSDAGSTAALYASVFIWICNLVSILVVCWFYGHARGLREGLPAALALSLVQGGLTLVLSQVDPTLSGFTAGIVGFALIFAVGRLPFYRHPATIDRRIFETAPAGAPAADSSGTPPTAEQSSSDEAGKPEPSMSLGKAFIPYYALVILAFVVLAVPAIKNVVAEVSFGPAFPKLTTTLGVVTKAADESVSIFTSAGTFLFAAAFIGFVAYALMGNIQRGGWSRVWAQTAMKATPSSIAVVALVAMSEVMKGGGQTDVLAQGTALLTGPFYPFLAPFIGLLGCFMTGSNLASNLIFGTFQQVTAHAAGLAHAPILAGQTSGAATGAMVAPPKVLLGTTTAGILGREGDVMRITFAVALPIAAIVGIISLFFA